MKNLIYQSSMILTAVGAILLCCSLFQARADLAYGEIAGQLSGFRYALFFLAVCVLLMELTGPTHTFTFFLPDALVAVLFGWALLSYDGAIDPQPEKLLFMGQLLLLWFLLRAVFQLKPGLRFLFLFVLICMGILTAFWCFIHLSEEAGAGRTIFREVDFSFRPAPAAAYLAVLLPLCLDLILRLGNCRKIRLYESRTGFYYVAWVGCVLLFAALLLLNERIAWIAALGASAWVAWLRIARWKRMKPLISRHHTLFALSTLLLFLFILALPPAANLFDARSEAERRLRRHIAGEALLEHPLRGEGMGSYPVCYARAQAAYLASPGASESEKAVAAAPVSVSNEYLRIGMELGLPGLVLFLLCIGVTLYYGLCDRMKGACGSLLALAILSLYAGPLEVPAFWILLVVLSTICVTGVAGEKKAIAKTFPYIGASTAVICLILLSMQPNPLPLYKEWKTLERLCERGRYRTAVEGYRCLYPALRHRSGFLHEGARCLCECGEIDEAIRWVDRALLLSADPELFYFKAELKRRKRAYPEAEACLKEVIGLLPYRAESYIRLAGLYADTAYFHPQKRDEILRRIRQFQLHGPSFRSIYLQKGS